MHAGTRKDVKMILRKAGLYWHTVRHLRFEQIWCRGWRIIRRPRLGVSIPAGSIRPTPSAAWIPFERKNPTLVGPDQFCFLLKEGALADVAWDGDQREKLWRYNQHYFDDLNARDSRRRVKWHRDLIANWLDNNPPAKGTGWEPYPTSLRIVNWVKWYLNGNLGNDSMQRSLAMQARWLSFNIEYHLLGNHLVSNAKALVFAGCFLNGKEADRWRKTGLNILNRELSEQILDDGGNFERSPMYHALCLEDVLDLINLARAYPEKIGSKLANAWQQKAETMCGWLAAMTHPDGEIAMFNDSARDIALKTSDLMQYARYLEVIQNETEPTVASAGITHLRDSGYIRMAMPDVCAFVDVAPLGPDYLPAHGHADTLSLEVSLFGQRLIVNGGTSCYGLSDQRVSERGTAAHSTVVVDGENSSEVWGGFRVARRAYPFDLVVSENPGHLSVSCSHNGYKRLKGAPVHRRSVILHADKLEVADMILGSCRNAASKFLLHHLIAVSQSSDDCFMLRLPTGDVIRLDVIEGRATLAAGAHAVRFGEVLPTSSINVDLVDARSRVHLSWQSTKHPQ